METQSHHPDITATRIERIRITGPINERSQCFAWLDENGFDIKRSGPYTDSEMLPDCDMKRFLIVAEKKEGEAMESKARDLMMLGIKIKGLNIKFGHVLLVLSVIMLVWLVVLTSQLANLQRRLDAFQAATEKRAGISEEMSSAQTTVNRLLQNAAG
jgi:hypothetical protein